MIDLEREQLLSLHDVPKLLPTRTNGKRIHISAVYRWVQRGIRGVHLEVIRIGGTTYTSREALQRFGATPAGARSSPPPNTRLSRMFRRDEQTARRIREILHGCATNNN